MNWERGLDESLRFWSDVFNPIGYFELIQDPTADKAKEQALHFAIKSGILTTGAGLVWALSGGGASMGMWFGASPPTAGRMFALKADTYRQLFHGARHAAPYLARAAPYAGGAAVVGGTIHALETGDTTYTVQHQLMMPAFTWWLGGIGNNDPRGGREYALFG